MVNVVVVVATVDSGVVVAEPDGVIGEVGVEVESGAIVVPLLLRLSGVESSLSFSLIPFKCSLSSGFLEWFLMLSLLRTLPLSLT